MTWLHELKFYLSEPAYLSQLCDWGLVWGSYFGMLSLFIAVVILKDRKAMYFGLLACLLAALLIVPAEHFHQQPTPTPTVQAAAVQKLRQSRRHNAWMFYAQAALAGLTCLVVGKSSTATGWLTSTILGSSLTGTVALWLQLKQLQVLGGGLPQP